MNTETIRKTEVRRPALRWGLEVLDYPFNPMLWWHLPSLCRRCWRTCWSACWWSSAEGGMVKRDSDDLSKTTDTEAKHLVVVRIRANSCLTRCLYLCQIRKYLLVECMCLRYLRLLYFIKHGQLLNSPTTNASPILINQLTGVIKCHIEMIPR